MIYEEKIVVRIGFYILIGLQIGVCGCSRTDRNDNMTLQEERMLVWHNPDSALRVLEQVDYEAMSAHEQYIYRMEHHLALSRVNHTPYYTEEVDSLLPYFIEQEDALSAGEAYYMLGTSTNHTSQYYASTHYLKQAENELLKVEGPLRDQLLGVTYFCLGNTSESEMLYSVAQQYYRKAIPLLEKQKNSIFLACAYRDIARTNAIARGERDTSLYYFEKARTYADESGSIVLQLDILAYLYHYCMPDSVSRRLSLCKALAEDYNVSTRYGEIVEIYLDEGKTDSAQLYLNRLQSRDSVYAKWFEDNYAYLHSKILAQKNQNDSAYRTLLQLYDHTVLQLQSDANARTFGIAQAYDVEREQRKAEEAKREQQWQRELTVALGFAFLMVVLVLILLWLYYRSQHKRQRIEMESLRNKYSNHLEMSRKQLQQQVNLTREIELQRMKGNMVEFPAWLQTYRNEKLVFTKERIDELIAETDKALDGAISRLRQQYPELTESDMQFVILDIIGATDVDMSIVLNVQKQTIYHRRQIVKKHINPQIEDIDAWLRHYANPLQ